MHIRSLAEALFFFVFLCPITATGTTDLTLPEARVALYFSQGGGAKIALLNAIAAAENSIHVHSFFLSDREIAAALISAHQRGVYVEAVLCFRGQTEAIDPQGRYLHAAGIPVYLNARYRAEHNKVMIFDRKIVQTGSYNYRFDADVLDAENVLFIESSPLAAVYLEDYTKRREEALPYALTEPFKEKDDPLDLTDSGESQGFHADYKNLRVETAFAPGDAKASILRHIQSALEKIIVHSYYLSDPDITHALIQAKRSGVYVEAVLSANAAAKDPQPFLAGDLVAAGIPIWLDGEHRNAHNKLIIYDNCIIQTGSYNLKKGVDLMNAENIIYVHSKDLVAVYMANYALHKAHSTPLEASSFFIDER